MIMIIKLICIVLFKTLIKTLKNAKKTIDHQ